ncbi:MFS transporter [Prauserella muralis]|uniref:MFS transporter n=1 Tax=Prauserella muralis TaxID=588067 RepID=A0A2V4AGH8_9PSEU|nr:MFS transporter [Prauserella muralis]PXY18959.1 MFS transporter [Prauserella muralis]TWE28843.1 MHS family alpha-ketoglutarate permease-like MFS transporter [Prauserella muralis]
MTEFTHVPAVSARARVKRTSLIGLGAGNAVEWFDWTVYATFASFFAGQFFQAGELASLLSTLAVFAVGFGARPFGGWLFGFVADRRGRRTAMALAVGLGAGGSFLIGVSPTADQIGIGAAVVLVVARLAQGLAHGGELPSAQTYVTEVAPPHRRGLWSSVIYVSGTTGILAGTLLGALLSSVLSAGGMAAFGWRIPFLLGGVLGLVAFFIRRRMPETEVFEADTAAQRDPRGEQGEKSSMWRTFRAHPGPLFQVVGLTSGFAVIYYVWAVAAPGFAITARGVEPEGALWASVAANCLLIMALPLWGAASDRFGRKPVLLTGTVLLASLVFPLDGMIQGSALHLFVAQSIALVLIAAIASAIPAVYAELFPTRVRATGFGVPYAISVAAFGGTAPYVQTLFAERQVPGMFGWYLIALLVVMVATIATIPETRGISLSAVEVENRREGRRA